MTTIMYSKLQHIIEEYAENIKLGIYGKPGSYFLTARELATKKHISSESACKLLSSLQAQHLIRLYNKRYYITNGYVSPDTPYGTQLAGTRRRSLAFVVNRIDSPFFAELSKLMSNLAAQNGYTLLVVCSNNHADRESQLIDELISLGVSGIFTNPSIAPEIRELYANCPLPVVSIGRDLQLSNCDTVLVDNASAGRQAADHLMDIGCDVFAYVGLAQYLNEDPRFRGYQDQLRDNHIRLHDRHVFALEYLHDNRIDISSVSGQLYDLLKYIQDGKKLGIFCYQDLLAVAILQRIKHISHRSKHPFLIPQDVAIIGFDDLPIASAITPALTTVTYQYVALVEKAFELMLDYISNPSHIPDTYEINSALVIRESSTIPSDT